MAFIAIFEAFISNFLYYNLYRRKLTVVVHFSSPLWFGVSNFFHLVAAPLKGWCPTFLSQTTGGTKVNDYGKFPLVKVIVKEIAYKSLKNAKKDNF